ncbi:hypothetical protein DLM77_15740 [Leptospira yasudae]|uniref:Uncharacterized protein n=1 Tax=Leptospira yasudae TaxID=2202201 RepID=A0ABX9M0M8_9LEPT|nr:hypothetical protein DLM77_15740 [Leptospira yasudae]
MGKWRRAHVTIGQIYEAKTEFWANLQLPKFKHDGSPSNKRGACSGCRFSWIRNRNWRKIKDSDLYDSAIMSHTITLVPKNRQTFYHRSDA